MLILPSGFGDSPGKDQANAGPFHLRNAWIDREKKAITFRGTAGRPVAGTSHAGKSGRGNGGFSPRTWAEQWSQPAPQNKLNRHEACRSGEPRFEGIPP